MEPCLHYMLRARVDEQMETMPDKIDQQRKQVNEARADGDLRENSPYDAAREKLQKLYKERDALQSLQELPLVKNNDMKGKFQEGCVIRLTVFSQGDSLSDDQLKELADKVDRGEEVPFLTDGILLFGGSSLMFDLVHDYSLDEKTPIGRWLLTHEPGAYSIQVGQQGRYVNFKASHVNSETLGDGNKLYFIYNDTVAVN